MKMKLVACLAFLLNTLLFATYYPLAKEALGRVDPVVFSFLEMTTLAPIGLCIILCSWQHITSEVVKRGLLLGSCLYLALFTICITLKYTSATSTAFFPSLNGFLAAFIAWFFLRQPIAKATWVAGILSVIGSALLIMNSSMGGVRGTIIAFLGGAFFTWYVFLSDAQHDKKIAPLSLFGVELLTMAVWASLVALLFSDWHAVHFSLPKDAWIVLYVAGACTFLPTLIAVLMQKHISPVTVSYIYILEPILGAFIANLYLHETLPFYGYIGGGLVVFGALVHTWGTAWASSTASRSEHQASRKDMGTYTGGMVEARPISTLSLVGALIYPIVLFGGGTFLFYRLSGFPPTAWRSLYESGLLPFTQARTLLLVQALCWLLAWTSFVIAEGIALLHAYSALKEKLPSGVEDRVKGMVFAPQPAVEWETRYLRQVGVISSPPMPGTAEDEEKPLSIRINKRVKTRWASVGEQEGAGMTGASPLTPTYSYIGEVGGMTGTSPVTPIRPSRRGSAPRVRL